jgi:hypothetical protein
MRSCSHSTEQLLPAGSCAPLTCHCTAPALLQLSPVHRKVADSFTCEAAAPVALSRDANQQQCACTSERQCLPHRVFAISIVNYDLSRQLQIKCAFYLLSSTPHCSSRGRKLAGICNRRRRGSNCVQRLLAHLTSYFGCNNKTHAVSYIVNSLDLSFNDCFLVFPRSRTRRGNREHVVQLPCITLCYADATVAAASRGKESSVKTAALSTPLVSLALHALCISTSKLCQHQNML